EPLSQHMVIPSDKPVYPFLNKFLWSHLVGDDDRQAGTHSFEYCVTKSVGGGREDENVGRGVESAECLSRNKTGECSLEELLLHFGFIRTVTGYDNVDVTSVFQSSDKTSQTLFNRDATDVEQRHAIAFLSKAWVEPVCVNAP